MDNTFIKKNYKDLAGQVYNGVKFVEYQFTQKSCDFWKCKCHCGAFFTARSYDIIRGHTKSCGCRRRATTRNTGLSNRGKNILQLSQFGYLRCFFRGKDSYFLADNTSEAREHLDKGCFSKGNRKGSNFADPIRKINDKFIKFVRLIAKTPEGQEADHIDHQPLDCRIINIRNGTSLQNKANTPLGVGKVRKLKSGKYGIKFPDELSIDTSSLIFDTKQEASKKRREIEAEKFGDWTYEKSQEIAKEIATYEFTFDPHVDVWAETGTLGEIMHLSPDNVLNARVRDIKEAVKRGDIYPDEEWRLQHDLMYDYHHANA